METTTLRGRDGDVVALQTAVRNGDFGLANAPDLVRLVLEKESWRERIVGVTGEVARFDSFAAFVRAPLVAGLQTDVDTLIRLCRDDPQTLDLIDRATTGPRGRPASKKKIANSNVLRGTPTGTTRQRALRHLRTARPDLHARVLAGEVSPHGAMVEAGLRRQTVTVPLEPAAIARTLRRRLTPEQIVALVALLEEVPS